MGRVRRRRDRDSRVKGIKHPTLSEEAAPSILQGRYGFAIAPLLIIITTLLIYSNTLSVPFILDDEGSIVKNDAIRDLSGFWPPSASGSRYTGYLSFAVNYYFGGLNVTGYHIVNILIHIINGLLVWRFIVLTFRTPWMERAGISRLRDPIAIVSSLIFVSHPLQTQAVTYIVQRFASLAALFYLLSLVLFVRGRLSSGPWARWAFYLTSLLSAILAMKAKEISFTLPFIICLYEFTFFERKASNIKRLYYLIPILLSLPIIPLSLVGTGRPLGEIIGELSEVAHPARAIPRGVYLLTQFRVIVTYIRLLFLPVNQNLDYDYPFSPSLFDPGTFTSFLFLLSLFVFAILLFKRSRAGGNGYALLTSFGIFWFFITLSVESSIIPIGDVIFEHRLYLPGVGVAAAFTSAVFWGLGRLSRRVSILSATCCLLLVTVVPLSIAAYSRNLVWRDGVTLWEDVVKKSPGKARPHSQLGFAYYAQGRIDEAIEEYKEAIRFASNDPYAPESHYNLGAAYDEKGRLDEAIAEYRKAIRLKHNFAEARYNLGLAYYAQGRIDEAIEEYREAIRFGPGDPDIHFNLGLAYIGKGLKKEAAGEFKETLRLNPQDREAYRMLENVR